MSFDKVVSSPNSCFGAHEHLDEYRPSSRASVDDIIVAQKHQHGVKEVQRIMVESNVEKQQ